MTRYIGIRPRKKTADKMGRERPTQLCIIDGDQKPLRYNLEDSQAEMNFVKGVFPAEFRRVAPGEDISHIPIWHLRTRLIKKEENLVVHGSHIRRDEKDRLIVIEKIAIQFDGVKPGDTIAMSMGGGPSSDYLGFAFARESLKHEGAQLVRIAPLYLNARRGGGDKDNDTELLATLARDEPDLFEIAEPRDLNIMRLCMANDMRIQAMKARIAAGQRLEQLSENLVFTGADIPEADVRKEFERIRASDPIYSALETEEKKREDELVRITNALPVFQTVFDPIPGMGPKQAAKIIAAIIDIRRFIVEPDAEMMEELKNRMNTFLDAAQYSQIAGRIPESVEPNRWIRKKKLAELCEREGDRIRAQHLYAAAAEEQKRAQLRRRAFIKSRSKFIRYCGLHVMEDGSFPRRRSGQVANWSGEARQGFYIFASLQLLKYQAKSPWGERLKAERERYRATHPKEITVAKELMDLFRAAERFFRLKGTPPDAKNFDLTTVAGLQAYFAAGEEMLSGHNRDMYHAELAKIAKPIEREFKLSGKTPIAYSAKHLINMAMWKTMRLVAEREIFRRWWDFEKRGVQAEAPSRRKTRAA